MRRTYFLTTAAGMVLAASSSNAQAVGSAADGVPAKVPASAVPIAHGSGSAAVTPSQATAQPGLADIVVTARRRNEREQDVPVAVSVLGANALKANSVTSVLDVSKNVPAFQMVPQAQGKNSVAYTIRSQRQGEQVITQDGSVGAYFADVVMARTQGANGALFDIGSVQVLKGPQGTLFGRNTTGGAVLISPVAPSDKFEGYLTAGFGNYSERLVEGAVNIPLADWAALRVGGQIKRRDGYITNIYNGQKLEDDHTDSYRVSLKLTPASNLTNMLVINSYRVNENGAGPVLDAVSAPTTTFFPGITAALAATKAAGFYATDSNDAASAKIQSTIISNTTTLDLGGITLKNIFGYRYLRSALVEDGDGSPYSVFPVYDFLKEHQFSDELQVLGKLFHDRLNYIVGAYYFREPGSETNGNAPLGAERRSIADATNLSRSVFAQVDYKVLSNLSVTLGGRETWDRRSIDWMNVAGRYNGPYTCALTNGVTPLNPCERSASTNFSKFTYTASIDWHPSKNVLLYAVHREGYRAGGYNLRANTPAQSIPFAPEDVKDYEIGAKIDWRVGGVRGRFNVAAYHQDYTNIQRQQSLLINGVFAGSIIANAAKAKIDGVEVEGMIQPVRGLEISGFFSYSNPRYTSYDEVQPNGTVVDISNAPFAGAPKYSGGGSVRYAFPATDLGEFAVSANVYAQSLTYGQDSAIFRTTLQPEPLAQIKGWTTTNARLEWNDIAHTKLSAAFWVKNLFKEKYNLSTLDLIDNGLGLVVKWRGEPRTYGGTLTFQF